MSVKRQREHSRQYCQKDPLVLTHGLPLFVPCSTRKTNTALVRVSSTKITSHVAPNTLGASQRLTVLSHNGEELTLRQPAPNVVGKTTYKEALCHLRSEGPSCTLGASRRLPVLPHNGGELTLRQPAPTGMENVLLPKPHRPALVRVSSIVPALFTRRWLQKHWALASGYLFFRTTAGNSPYGSLLPLAWTPNQPQTHKPQRVSLHRPYNGNSTSDNAPCHRTKCLTHLSV